MDIPPVVIIGIDGADWRVIDPLIEAGRLPVLAKLRREGVAGPLASTIPPISAAAWTSIATGVRPDKHAIVDFAVADPTSYRTHPVTSRDVRAVPFWTLAGHELDGIGILNVPMTYPPQSFNGWMVSGFPTPEEFGRFTHPPGLLAELRQNLGSDFHFQPRAGSFDEKDFYDEVWAVTRFVKEATLHLITSRQLRLLMTVFVGPDALGHTFWRHYDPAHPQHRSVSRRFGEAIPDIYQEVDCAIGEILAHLPDDARILVVSDHGFGAALYAVSLNTWLADRGYLTFRPTLSTKIRRGFFKAGLTPARLFSLTKRLGLATKVQESAYSSQSPLQTLRRLFLVTEGDIDWSRTVAYCQGNLGQVFVNLQGRQPQGIVPAAQYDQVLDELTMELESFHHNGERVFDSIYRMNEVYGKDKPYSVPDLVCMHSQGKYVVQRMFELASNRHVIPTPFWSGVHHPTGVFMAYDGKRAIRRGVALDGMNMTDVAPLVLYLLGLDVPDAMDGRVRYEIIDQGYLEQHPVRYRAIGEATVAGGDLESAEEDAILKRLGDLGYI